jgi:predicted dehydrogenase
MGTIDAALERSAGSVMVGFNRRFAPASLELKRQLAGCAGPKTASLRVMAGKLDPLHWYATFDESGGRVLGEACHFLDYLCFLFDSEPVRVTAQTVWPVSGRLPFPDSVSAQVAFGDGSCGQLIYTAEGDATWPKETLTVFGAGLAAEITDFQRLVIHRGRRVTRQRHRSKGHAEEMAGWAAFLRGEGDHPLPYEISRRSMQVTFAVLDSIREGHGVTLGS